MVTSLYTKLALLPLALVLLWSAAANVASAAEPVVKASSMQVNAGQSIRLGLKLPTGESWSDANIGQAIVRTFGWQEQINTSSLSDKGEVTLTLTQPGFALIIVDAGPASEKARGDAWQRTTWNTKLVIRVNDADGSTDRATMPSDPGIMAKVGSKLEVLPYIDVTTLRPGGDLPVRIYHEGSKQSGETVHAYGPGGVHTTAVSDSVGVATLKVTAAGTWMVRYEKTVEGVKYTADLLFEVPANQVETPAAKAKGVGE